MLLLFNADYMLLAFNRTAVEEMEEINKALATTYKITNVGTAR
jgi:hypothetical protein